MFDLKSTIQYLLPTTSIKIGAQNGSGYFYCGTAAHLLQHLDEYNEKTKAFFAEYAESAKKELDDIQRRTPEPPRDWLAVANRKAVEVVDGIIERARSGDSTGADKRIMKYFDECSKYTAKAARVNAKAKRAQKLLDEYVPLNERTVVEQFYASSIAEPSSVTVIMISGCEGGKYWTTDEARYKSHFALSGTPDSSKCEQEEEEDDRDPAEDV
jgi:hypothetical protein